MYIKLNLQTLRSLRQHQDELEQQNEELRHAYSELDNVRTRYFDLFHKAPLGYLIVNETGVICDANHTAAEIFRVSEETLTGTTLQQHIAPDDQDNWYLLSNRLLTNDGMLEGEIRILCGTSVLWTRFAVTKTQSPEQGSLYRIAISDITCNKQVEHALQESEKRFHQLAEHDRIYYWECDLTGLYSYVSPSIRTILGFTADEVVEKMYAYDFLPPHERQHFKEMVLRAMAQGKIFKNVENRMLTKCGDYIWVATNGLPILDAIGRVSGYRGTNFDINDRKLAQAQQTMFSANAAHQLRTPLTVVHAYSETLADGVTSVVEAQQYGRTILNSCMRMEKTIAALLLLTRLDSSQSTLMPKETFDIAILLRDQLTELQTLYSAKLQTVAVVCQHTSIIRTASSTLLVQIFNNLIDNALKYTPCAGHISIMLSIDNNNSIVLEVSNNGNAIAASDLPHIFDRFFRSNMPIANSAVGSGLGLSVVKQIVTFLRGTITITSDSDKGTKVTVILPL